MKELSKEEIKKVMGGRVSFDCVFSFSDGHTEHWLYSGDTGQQVQCNADDDAYGLGEGCTGADCIGSPAC